MNYCVSVGSFGKHVYNKQCNHCLSNYSFACFSPQTSYGFNFFLIGGYQILWETFFFLLSIIVFLNWLISTMLSCSTNTEN